VEGHSENVISDVCQAIDVMPFRTSESEISFLTDAATCMFSRHITG